MLQQKEANDYVIGTGKMHSVRDFAKLAFSHVGLDYKKYILFKRLKFLKIHNLLMNIYRLLHYKSSSLF